MVALSEGAARRCIEDHPDYEATNENRWMIRSIDCDVPLITGSAVDAGAGDRLLTHIRWTCPICGDSHLTIVRESESVPALWFCENGGIEDVVLVHWTRDHEHSVSSFEAEREAAPAPAGAGDLWSPDEGSRRIAIMSVSRCPDRTKIPRLLQLLGKDSYSNRRHIVRALGTIGGADVEAWLIQMVSEEHGLILGDIAQALGRIGSVAAEKMLQELELHEMEWVRQNARGALKRIAAEE